MDYGTCIVLAFPCNYHSIPSTAILWQMLKIFREDGKREERERESRKKRDVGLPLSFQPGLCTNSYSSNPRNLLRIYTVFFQDLTFPTRNPSELDFLLFVVWDRCVFPV